MKDDHMPNRILRDWTTSTKFKSLTAEAERVFTRLIMKVDDFGRYEADMTLLCSHLFPLNRKVSEDDMGKWINECVQVGLIKLYKVNGKTYLQVENFNQRLRTMNSKCPAPDSTNVTDGGQMTVMCQSDGGQMLASAEAETETETDREGRSPQPPTPIPEADKPKRFTPPTIEDVTAYCAERKNTVDPQKFVDHYTSNGWLVGRNKMKDWKAAVRTWERSQFDNRTASNEPPAPKLADILRPGPRRHQCQ